MPNVQRLSNASDFVVTYTPTEYDLTLEYDPNNPLNFYNYAKADPSSAGEANGHFNTADFLPAQHRQEQLHDIEDNIDDVFHITSYETIQVPYKAYNTILRHAYVESIKSSIIELPLDSDNYNLLIVLPDVDNSLDNVMATMRNDFSINLRELRRRLRPNWIKTIVPKFHQKGNIVLTGDLMKVCCAYFSNEKLRKKLVENRV